MPDVEWQIISMGTSFVVACLETIAHWTILRRTRARILFLPIALTIVGYAYSAYVGPNEKSWQLSVLSALTSLATVAAYVSLPAAPSILRWFRWLALAKLLLLLTNAVGWVNAGETAASNLWMLAFPYFIFGVGHMALMFKVFWNLNLADLAQTPHNNK